jgi:hypothetical protein
MKMLKNVTKSVAPQRVRSISDQTYVRQYARIVTEDLEPEKGTVLPHPHFFFRFNPMRLLFVPQLSGKDTNYEMSLGLQFISILLVSLLRCMKNVFKSGLMV